MACLQAVITLILSHMSRKPPAGPKRPGNAPRYASNPAHPPRLQSLLRRSNSHAIRLHALTRELEALAARAAEARAGKMAEIEQALEYFSRGIGALKSGERELMGMVRELRETAQFVTDVEDAARGVEALVKGRVVYEELLERVKGGLQKVEVREIG